MADNIGYTPGSGVQIAADEINSALHQRIKITVGPDGEGEDASEQNPLPVADSWSRDFLSRILNMLMSPLGYDKSINRQRGTVVLESGTLTTVGTVTTVTTVSTVNSVTAVAGVNNIVAVGGFPAQMQILDGNRTSWALGVRARIT
jgi:hypothetical protein